MRAKGGYKLGVPFGIVAPYTAFSSEVSRCHTPTVLDLIEEPLDQVARLVKICAIDREADTVGTLAPSSPMPWRTRNRERAPSLMQGCAVNSRIHMLSSLTLTCL